MSAINVPSNPTDRKKLSDGIKEMVNSMARIQSEREYIKEAIDDLAENFEIEKKYIRRMAKDAFKDEFNKECAEFDEYAELYKTVMLNDDNSNEEDDDDDNEE